jgi:hypothetical protein
LVGKLLRGEPDSWGQNDRMTRHQGGTSEVSTIARQRNPRSFHSVAFFLNKIFLFVPEARDREFVLIGEASVSYCGPLQVDSAALRVYTQRLGTHLPLHPETFPW